MMGDETYAWLVETGVAGKRYALTGDEVAIGRGTGSDIRLRDPRVSRSHARITMKGGQVIIEDLKSAHGVLVNGRKVEKAALTDGDQVQIGDTLLALEIQQDAMGTVMAPAVMREPAGQPCRYCHNPVMQGEAYCSMCGALTRTLPEPFGFIQQAYLQLKALHQSGRMDAATFRAELEKMVIADGSGGYWMIGIQSGRWHWYNGSEWVQREPPSTPLQQAPLVEPQAPPPPPPVVPPPDPGLTEAEEGTRTRRLFLIGGGALIAFSILAIGAYAAFQLINANDEPTDTALGVQPPAVSDIVEPEPIHTATETATLAPAATSTASPEPTSLPYSLRPYDSRSDEQLSRLTDFVAYVEAESSPERSIYEGTWYVQQPVIFGLGWCAIDQATLAQNLQVIQMELEVDGHAVEPELMFEEERVDAELACKSSRIVLEFLEPGEHRIQWRTSYSEPVFDGWDTLEAGTYLNDYVLEVRTATKVQDEFNESSGRWDESAQQNFSLWTEGGGFHIQVHKQNFAAWSIYHDLTVRDVFMITHAKRVSTEGGAYGLIARSQDVNNFYYFLIDDTGYFTLGKRLAGEYIDLMGWTASEAILSGEEPNRLGITISGNEIVAFINSQVVGTVSDDSIQEGSVGLIAQSVPEVGEMHAVFDLFFVEYYE